MDHNHRDDDERRSIVQRYLKGPEKARAQDDDWENPIFSLAAVTDRYGFIHDKPLPPKFTKHEAKTRKVEISRIDKWMNMLNKWDHYYTNSEKLRDRVYKGIPDRIRGKAWLLLMEVSNVRAQKEGVYKQMLDYGLQNSKDVRQIDLDVNRTFRNHEFFRDRYCIKQIELFKVLVAYSVYNTEIGYTQGMSQIAALLLMYISGEEDAFWSLDRLMSSDKYAMHGFFIDGFPKFNRFAAHHDKVLEKFLPALSKHFKKYDIHSTLYTLKWFFQCFIDRVPFSLTLRIWDCFMLDGEMILTCMSYTLLKLHKRTLLTKGMEDLLQFLQNELEEDFGYFDDQVIEALKFSIQELKRKKMESPRSADSSNERPRKPFGMLLNQDSISMMTGDDRSIAGSIVFRGNDSVSLAHTSRSGSIKSVIENSRPVSELEDADTNGYVSRRSPLIDDRLSACDRQSQRSVVFTDLRSTPENLVQNASSLLNGNDEVPFMDEVREQAADIARVFETDDIITSIRGESRSEENRTVDEKPKSTKEDLKWIDEWPDKQKNAFEHVSQYLTNEDVREEIKNPPQTFVYESNESRTSEIVETNQTYHSISSHSSSAKYEESDNHITLTTVIADSSIVESITMSDDVTEKTPKIERPKALTSRTSIPRLSNRPSKLDRKSNPQSPTTPSSSEFTTHADVMISPRQSTVSNNSKVESPSSSSITSPTNGASMIPRLSTRRSSKSKDSNGNVSVVNGSRLKSPTSLTNGAKVRIFVPYGDQQTTIPQQQSFTSTSCNDSNKIKIQVNSATSRNEKS